MNFTRKLKKIFRLRRRGFRKTGYYWVKRTFQGSEKWRVAFYHEEVEVWYFPGESRSYFDRDLIRINEQRILFIESGQVVIPSFVWQIMLILCIVGFSLSLYSLINIITK